MTEQQYEALEKLFPDGYICVGIMPNKTIHVAYSNKNHSKVLSAMEDLIHDAVEAVKEEQEEMCEGEDDEPDEDISDLGR